MAPRKKKKNVLVQRMVCSFLVILFFLCVYAKNINTFFQNTFSAYFNTQGAEVAAPIKAPKLTPLEQAKIDFDTYVSDTKKMEFYYIFLNTIITQKLNEINTIAVSNIKKKFTDIQKDHDTFVPLFLASKTTLSGYLTAQDPKAFDKAMKPLASSLKSLAKDIATLQNTANKLLDTLSPGILKILTPTYTELEFKPVSYLKNGGKKDIIISWEPIYNYNRAQYSLSRSYGVLDNQGVTELNSQDISTTIRSTLHLNIVEGEYLPTTDDIQWLGTDKNKSLCFDLSALNSPILTKRLCLNYYDIFTGGVAPTTGGSLFIDAPVPNFTASNITARSATFSWNLVPGSVGYAIYRDDTLVKVVKANEPLSYTEPPILMPESEYVYTIIPLNSFENVPKKLLEVTASLNPLKRIAIKAQEFFGIQEVYAVSLRTIRKIKTGTLGDIPKTGEMKILAVVFRWSDTPLEQNLETIPALKLKLSGTSDSVREFYERESFGKLKITPQVVSSVVTIDYPASTEDDFHNKNLQFIPDVNQAIYNLGYNLNNYNTIIYVFPYNKEFDFGGVAPEFYDKNTSFTRGVVFINGSQDVSVYSHEIGHVLGFYHAISRKCDTQNDAYLFDLNCVADQYGDNTDVMGGGHSQGALSDNFYAIDGYRKFQSKWINEKKITSTGIYEIFPNDTAKAMYYNIDLNNKTTLYLNYYVDRKSRYNFSVLKLKISSGGASIIYWFKNPELSILDLFSTDGSYKVPLVDFKDSVSPRELKTVRIIQLSKDSEKAKVFIRFDDKTLVTTKININDSKKIDIDWTPIPDLYNYTGGYRLYRDYNPDAGPQQPIYIGRSVFFTDEGVTDNNEHTYTVIPYDAFTELPGKEYPMTPSDPSAPIKISLQSPTSSGTVCKKVDDYNYSVNFDRYSGSLEKYRPVMVTDSSGKSVATDVYSIVSVPVDIHNPGTISSYVDFVIRDQVLPGAIPKVIIHTGPPPIVPKIVIAHKQFNNNRLVSTTIAESFDCN